MHNASLPPMMTSMLSSLKGTSSVIQSLVLIGALCVTTVDAAPLQNTSIATMPQPVSNNAIALVHTNNKSYLLSFMGLAPEKNHLAVHNHAWALSLTEKNSQWKSIADVPHIAPLAGRLASIAIGINDKAYVFGGYTVAENHDEISTIDNY